MGTPCCHHIHNQAPCNTHFQAFDCPCDQPPSLHTRISPPTNTLHQNQSISSICICILWKEPPLSEENRTQARQCRGPADAALRCTTDGTTFHRALGPLHSTTIQKIWRKRGERGTQPAAGAPTAALPRSAGPRPDPARHAPPRPSTHESSAQAEPAAVTEGGAARSRQRQTTRRRGPLAQREARLPWGLTSGHAPGVPSAATRNSGAALMRCQHRRYAFMTCAAPPLANDGNHRQRTQRTNQ